MGSPGKGRQRAPRTRRAISAPSAEEAAAGPAAQAQTQAAASAASPAPPANCLAQMKEGEKKRIRSKQRARLVLMHYDKPCVIMASVPQTIGAAPLRGPARMMADPLNHDVILSKVQDTINAEIKTGLTLSRENHALAENFKERHGSILKELNTIGHFTRKVAMLIQDEKHKLLQSCKNFADRWPRAYPYHRMMTPKGHILTHHLPHYVQHWGTIGLFGEDGLESLHSRYAKFQRSAASLPNTRESMLCTHDHLNLSQYFHATRPESTTRRMQRPTEAAVANADESAANAQGDLE